MRRVFSNILLLLGVFTLLYPLFSRLEAFSWQASLWQEQVVQVSDPEDPVLLVRPDMPGRGSVGDSATVFLEIPRIKVSAVVVRGTLRKSGSGINLISLLSFLRNRSAGAFECFGQFPAGLRRSSFSSCEALVESEPGLVAGAGRTAPRKSVLR